LPLVSWWTNRQTSSVSLGSRGMDLDGMAALRASGREVWVADLVTARDSGLERCTADGHRAILMHGTGALASTETLAGLTAGGCRASRIDSRGMWRTPADLHAESARPTSASERRYGALALAVGGKLPEVLLELVGGQPPLSEGVQ
jgi:hypothetical protein